MQFKTIIGNGQGCDPAHPSRGNPPVTFLRSMCFWFLAAAMNKAENQDPVLDSPPGPVVNNARFPPVD